MLKYKTEIEYREQLLEKRSMGQRLTEDERFWLVTNPVYNRWHGYPFYNKDVISLRPNILYSIHIKIIEMPDRTPVTITLGVSDRKGKLISDEFLLDIDGNGTKKKTTKVLQFDLDKNKTDYYVKFKSEIGLLDISYGCDYYDERMKLFKKESSSTGNPCFAMIKDVISEVKVRYKCKHPKVDMYDMLIFEIETEPIII